MDTDIINRKGHRQKSPNAPAYSLQECQEDTRKIFRAEGQVSLSRESIAEHLGLAAQSGPFNRKLSSLRQYGLLDPMGKDLRVSDLFLRIDHATDETERRRGLREAVGRPAIFQGLLAQYENSGLPSDLNLTNQLVLKYRFTKKNAETVAKAFLESCRFAGLNQGRLPTTSYPPPPPGPLKVTSPESLQSHSRDSFLDHDRRKEDPQTQCRQEIPLGTGRRAVIELPEDVKTEEIAKIIRVLQALSGPDT
ncbi:MAG: winged helix-turn-helix domain-containing protein [Deltaproteobacteria bacterium]|nr:winged helix-turn-helix domain-containing protein [Deltaproteobacteria bacterium]